MACGAFSGEGTILDSLPSVGLYQREADGQMMKKKIIAAQGSGVRGQNLKGVVLECESSRPARNDPKWHFGGCVIIVY